MIKKRRKIKSLTGNFQMKKCRVHHMPPLITDDDIEALFLGLVNVVKRKAELDEREKFNIVSESLIRGQQELKEARAECARLKNEIIYLKCLLEKQNLVSEN